MRRGFSLVELSIVLVILGLLVGGILAGRSLIRASELRGQIADFTHIRSAHMAFRDKYLCMPGDCPRTSTIIGTSASYDGDGDGRVRCWIGGYVDECREYFYSMRQTGMISNSQLAGTSGESEYYRGKLEGSTMYVHFSDRYSGNTGNRAAIIHLVKLHTPWARGALLTPEDAWNMDTKMDDGVASRGGIYAFNGGDTSNTDQPCLASGNYDLTYTSVACRIDYVVE